MRKTRKATKRKKTMRLKDLPARPKGGEVVKGGIKGESRDAKHAEEIHIES